MRSETASKAFVELHASGAIVQTSNSQPEEHLDSIDEEDDLSTETDMCDMDYPLGKDGCHCAEDHHKRILQEEMCIQAAKEAGATAPTGVFRIGSEFFHKRPKGCFKFKCREDPRGICYFFNPIGNDPAQCSNATTLPDGTTPKVEGVPVCKRPKFLNGTHDGNGGCPNGYNVIMNEDNCAEAGTCLGHCEGAEFRKAVLNESMHDEYPEGCFVDNERACVWYNQPLAHFGPPKRPRGTPICNVSKVVDFRDQPEVAEHEREHTSAGNTESHHTLKKKKKEAKAEGEAAEKAPEKADAKADAKADEKTDAKADEKTGAKAEATLSERGLAAHARGDGDDDDDDDDDN